VLSIYTLVSDYSSSRKDLLRQRFHHCFGIIQNWAVNNGDARIPPAVTVRSALSRRQLLIVRGDLAGYIQSFVPSRSSVSPSRPLSSTTMYCVVGWPRVDQRHLQSRKNNARARASRSIRRKGVIAFVALRKLSRPIAAWTAWEIILRCRERGKPSNGSRSSREIGNLVTSLLSRHGFTLDERESFRASIINSRRVHSDSCQERVEFLKRTH